MAILLLCSRCLNTSHEHISMPTVHSGRVSTPVRVHSFTSMLWTSQAASRKAICRAKDLKLSVCLRTWGLSLKQMKLDSAAHEHMV